MTRKLAMLLTLSIIICLGGSSGVIASEVHPSYSYIDLGALNESNTYPMVVNDYGMAVGQSQISASGASHAFLWTKKQGMKDLGALSQLGGSLADLDRSCAWNLNFTGGKVVGESWNADYESEGPNPMSRAFLWEKNKGMKDLGTLGGNYSGAYGCNDLGWVVGAAETDSPGIFHAFYWTKKQGITDLGRPGEKQSTAWAINNLNQVVGEVETDTPEVIHGFLWHKGRGLRDLEPLPGGGSCAAYGLNYTHIVGVSENADGAIRAVLWQIYKSGVRDLGDLGGSYSLAWSINDRSHVVGTAETETPETFHAFIWTPARGMQDLNDLVALPQGVTLTLATSINHQGQILAQSDDSNGITHAFLLSPNNSCENLKRR